MWHWLRALICVCWMALLLPWAAHAREPETLQLALQRTADGLFLSARLGLSPAHAVEDALQKSVPLYFVWQADVYRKRWYWTDKRVSSAVRTLRLAFRLDLSLLPRPFQIGMVNQPDWTVELQRELRVPEHAEAEKPAEPLPDKDKDETEAEANVAEPQR
ncbi:MAG: hypothetical protein A3G82_04610 [Burkholderiales bacterium RIFCSPLOWO2_12_FULL_67_210]|nr:MAG: hypothetical protein A3G82_04610 [Burkholderiales bacterium RIFCSPLOWO2_12_FULL_67_210]